SALVLRERRAIRRLAMSQSLGRHFGSSETFTIDNQSQARNSLRAPRHRLHRALRRRGAKSLRDFFANRANDIVDLAAAFFDRGRNRIAAHETDREFTGRLRAQGQCHERRLDRIEASFLERTANHPRVVHAEWNFVKRWQDAIVSCAICANGFFSIESQTLKTNAPPARKTR